MLGARRCYLNIAGRAYPDICWMSIRSQTIDGTGRLVRGVLRCPTVLQTCVLNGNVFQMCVAHACAVFQVCLDVSR